MIRYNNLMVKVAFLSFFLTCSCTTVKEERRGCPCTLTIDVASFAALEDCPTALVQVQGNSLIRNTVLPREFESTGYELGVDRRLNHVTVIGGLRHSILAGDTLSVANGKEADPLMCFNQIVDCEGELSFVKAVPHKKWCDVHIILLGEDSMEDYPYDIVLSADCNAMCVSSGLPIWGNYRVLVDRSKVGSPVVRMPRQKENALRLDFFTRNGEGYYSGGNREFYLDIGHDMEMQGYDWNKEDLDDVYVYVDYASMKTNINIIEWDITKLNVDI